MTPLTFKKFPYDPNYVDESGEQKVTISSLPNEIIVKIFSMLSFPDLRTCALISKHWQHLSFCNTLWNKVTLKQIKISVASLEKILNQKVKIIHFEYSEILNQESLILPFFKTASFDILQCLNLCSASIITPSLLEELLSLTPNLKEFQVQPCLVNKNLSNRLTTLKHIKKLSLKRAHIVLDDEILQIFNNAEKFHELEFLSLRIANEDFQEFIANEDFQEFTANEDFQEFIAKFLEIFLNLCSNLKYIYLFAQIGFVNDEALKRIIQMKYLEEIDLFPIDIRISTDLLQTLQHSENLLVNLRKFKINFVEIETHVLFMLIELCPNIEYVTFFGPVSSRIVTFNDFERFLALQHLKELELTKICIKMSLQNFNHLNEFKSSQMSSLDLCCYECLDAQVVSKILLCCYNLSKLIIDNLFLDDEVLKSVSQLKQLEYLKFSYIRRTFSNKASNCTSYYGILDKLRFLQFFYVEYEPHTVLNEIMLSMCPNLTDLRLRNMAIDYKVWKWIILKTELRSLWLHSINEVSLTNELVQQNIFPLFRNLDSLLICYSKMTESPFILEAVLLSCSGISDLFFIRVCIKQKLFKAISSLKKLKKLRLDESSKMSENELSAILKGCPILTYRDICINTGLEFSCFW